MAVFEEIAENNNNVLVLAILNPRPPYPQNHSVQTTSRPTLSGKSRFRKKEDTIDSTTYKKENIMCRPRYIVGCYRMLTHFATIVLSQHWGKK